MSGKKRSKLALAAFLLVAGAAVLPADTFNFSGDSTTMTLAEGGQHALLTGHARVESQDLRITADTIELFGKDFIYASCRGNVHVIDARRGLDLTSQQLFYDRDQKISRIRGNAMMADVKNEMVVKGGFIEDRDTEQITIVQIGVRIFKKDIVCRSEFARYQRDKKILELSGMPWVSKGGDVYQAARITINLDTEEISLEGSVQGTLEDKGKKASDAAGAGTDMTAGTSAGANPAPDSSATKGSGSGH
jgi:lipopolysaccharide export system protein LptA